MSEMNTRAPKNTWKAIRSYGIVLVRRNQDQYEYLMVCRRNTFSFVDFVLGKYKENDMQYVMQLILNMTFTERNTVRSADYKNMWERLYVKTRKSEGVFYEQVKSKFDRIKDRVVYLESKLPCLWKYPEWGFPKGRINTNEDSIECAKRELFEETMVKSDSYVIDMSINPFEEEFIGTNGHKYNNRFYIAFVNGKCDAFLDTNNTSQVREISQIRWFNFSKASKIVRCHEHSKKFFLKELNRLLTKKMFASSNYESKVFHANSPCHNTSDGNILH